ncbi:MAG: transposase [Verrucomicrobiota bacterium]
MAYNFTTCNRDQLYLLPPSMKDWLGEDHFVWFLLDAIEEMDLSAFHAAYRRDGKGQKAHNPKVMVAVLLYGYCHGERSSRQLERLCQESVPYRILASDTAPDHCAFARFRQRHEAQLKSLFHDILRLCGEAGVLKVGLVSLDGTKMKANASLAANRTLAGLEKEIAAMVSEAAARDAEEDVRYGRDRRGDELPTELRHRQDRLRRLAECQARLAAEKEAARREQENKLAQREAEEAASGAKKRGRRPKTPDQVVEAKAEAKANITDPGSAIMKTRQGYVQGYNAQAVVTAEQYVVAPGLTSEANDQRQLHPMLAAAAANLRAVGVMKAIGVALADAGYCSERNLSERRVGGPEILINTTKDWKRRQALREEPPPRGRIPSGLTVTERMERKLRTKRGSALYRQRAQTVEPVFGQIKDVRGLDRFSRRGESACASEWALICAAHNLLKLYRSGQAAWN